MQPTTTYSTQPKAAVFIIGTIALTLAITLLSAHFRWGYPSAFWLATGMYGAITAFAFWANNAFLQKLLVFGIAAGFTELIADTWLVNGIGSLVYPATEAKFWASPNYMPFAWAVILIQVGYVSWFYAQRFPLIQAMGLAFVLGASFIPIFESSAKAAGWWYYQPTSPMILNAPIYIIVAEGLITLVLPLVYQKLVEKGVWVAAIAGIVQGLWIWASYFLMYPLLG